MKSLRRLGRSGSAGLAVRPLRTVLGVTLVAHKLGVDLRSACSKTKGSLFPSDTYTTRARVTVRLGLLDTVTVRLTRHRVVGVVLRLRPDGQRTLPWSTYMVSKLEGRAARRTEEKPGNLPQYKVT